MGKNNRPVVIALCGLKQAGKSTAAKILAEDFGFARARFAAPLKSMLRELLRHAGANEDLIERMIEGDLKERPSPLLGGKSPRHAMQTLGTEWGRKMISDSLWVDITANGVEHILARGEPVVIEDLRFINEYQTVLNANALVIRIDRPGLEEADHQSEREIKALLPDLIINNSGTLEDLRDAVHRIVRGEGGR